MDLVTNNIRHYRRLAGLTQTDLAKLVGVSKNTISSIETLTFGCTLKLAIKISKALNTPIDTLFDFDSVSLDLNEKEVEKNHLSFDDELDRIYYELNKIGMALDNPNTDFSNPYAFK